MKIQMTVCSLLIAGAMILPGTARAGDDGWAAFGGFLGGVLISNLGECNTRTVHREVVVERYEPRVRYEYVRERYWVPGRYLYVRSDCGRTERRWEPGHYEYRKVRVERGYHRDRYAYSRRGCDW